MSLLGRSLDGETAFITGASAGIGAATAHRLAACGARVVLGARRTAKLDGVKAAIEAETPGATVVTLPLDVNDDASCAAWLAKGAELAAPPTILVNNAGLAAGTSTIQDSDPNDWASMLDTNVSAAFNMTRRVLTGMLERGRGDIIMVASVAGIDPYPKGAVYCATKAALQVFAKSLRRELLGSPLRVLTFDPGMVETEFSITRLGDEAKAAAVYAGMTPLTGDDIADCVAFAVTRPLHMSVDRMLILATAQSGATEVHRTSS